MTTSTTPEIPETGLWSRTTSATPEIPKTASITSATPQIPETGLGSLTSTNPEAPEIGLTSTTPAAPETGLGSRLTNAAPAGPSASCVSVYSDTSSGGEFWVPEFADLSPQTSSPSTSSTVSARIQNTR